MQHDHFPRYAPKSGIGRWFDARLPATRLLYDSFVAYPIPRNLNYWYTFGGILSFMLGVQIVTGVVLAMHYAADADLAFESVEKIMRDVNYGWLLRYMHATGASMFFIAVYIHIARGLYYGSYKAPREILWILGVIIFLLMMATAFMGYVLPWGQMSFWGATVITNLFSAIPLVGEAIVTWLWGGFAVGDPTLNRFYALHYLLPFMIAGVVMLHVWALHVTGQTNPTGIEVKSKQDVVPFSPHATMKDAVSLVVFLILFSWFLFYHPNYLGHADNYTKANPLVTPAHIVPEWYFLPFYAILRAIPSKLGGVIAMFGAIAVLFLVPWLDTSKVRSANYRPLYRQFFWILIVATIGLGYLGSKPPEGGYVIASRILTIYYFAHFLIILPLLGLFETPRPRPASIADAVLGGGSAQAGPQRGRARDPRMSRADGADFDEERFQPFCSGRCAGAARRYRSRRGSAGRGDPALPARAPAPRRLVVVAGPFGKYEPQQLQRGFQVYREVCAACHSMNMVAFRTLASESGPHFSEEQAAALAAEYQIADGPDADGEMFERPGRASDYFPSPFANEAAARVSNGGALPPDLSLIAKARAVSSGFPGFIFDLFKQYQESGPDYIYSLLTGYQDPPAGVEVPEGQYYNPYFISDPRWLCRRRCRTGR